ncbi:ribosome biogenesis protein Nop53/GLTSCR2 [Morchella snyderi]|nr:ribosome biogenesis protein Nop53/GLTSCR2 [Morchella snyderi]
MASKQPSRKGKKAWRKNVDISEINVGLDQLRDEIIQGGVIVEKTDEQLFALDTTGDAAIAKAHFKTAKVLKADEIISARSAVPAIRKRPGLNTTNGIIAKKARRANVVTYKDIERMKATAYGQEAASGELTSTKNITIDYDPWAEEAPQDVADKEALHETEFSFIPAPQPFKEPKTLKQPPVSLAVSGRPVPAVRVPEAGISYNPEFAQWDALLQKEGAKEVELEQKRLADKAKAERIKALAAIPDVEEDSDEEGYSTGTDTEAEKPVKKMPDRKTQAQRNKIKRRKELELIRLQEQKLKRQTAEFSLVKKYAKDVEARERLRLAKRAARLNIDDDEKNPKLMRRRKFGKVGLPRAHLELQLPDELADSLRTLKPEGNLLRDRMRSLRERGVLETRLPVTQRRKYQKKVSEKWSYKDFK